MCDEDDYEVDYSHKLKIGKLSDIIKLQQRNTINSQRKMNIVDRSMEYWHRGRI